MEETKEQKQQRYINDIKDDATTAVILLISLLVFGYFCAANWSAIGNLHYKTVEWQSIDKAQNNYNIFKNAFNAQKQVVVDAYNKQIDLINQNGLETEADFTGLRFNNNVFTDKINNSDQVLHYSHEATKAVNKLSETTVNAKIAKIKAFYDARVRSVYSALKNKQKVVLSSLTEYGRQPKNIQLTEADFTPIATKIVDTRVVATEAESGKLPKVCNAILALFFMILFSISAFYFCCVIDRMKDDIGYYMNL